jgi:hypothetical protein
MPTYFIPVPESEDEEGIVGGLLTSLADNFRDFAIREAWLVETADPVLEPLLSSLAYKPPDPEARPPAVSTSKAARKKSVPGEEKTCPQCGAAHTKRADCCSRSCAQFYSSRKRKAGKNGANGHPPEEYLVDGFNAPWNRTQMSDALRSQTLKVGTRIVHQEGEHQRIYQVAEHPDHKRHTMTPVKADAVQGS